MKKLEVADFDSKMRSIAEQMTVADQGFDKVKLNVISIETFIDKYVPIRTSLMILDYIKSVVTDKQRAKLDEYHFTQVHKLNEDLLQGGKKDMQSQENFIKSALNDKAASSSTHFKKKEMLLSSQLDSAPTESHKHTLDA